MEAEIQGKEIAGGQDGQSQQFVTDGAFAPAVIIDPGEVFQAPAPFGQDGGVQDQAVIRGAPGPSEAPPQKEDDRHKIYPYLLRGMEVKRPDHVWASDITYIRLQRGFVYLVAVMDWFSRYVFSWALSITLEADFCIEALERSLRRGNPEIFNTDQGSQYTSVDFTKILLPAGVLISMDSKGRVFDNIFIERLWRSLEICRLSEPCGV